MTNYLAIWWMCQEYTLQEDHVWWPARAKLHGKVFPWKWLSGETPLDILEMSHLHCMFGKQHEWDGMGYVGKTCVNMKCEKELGWKIEGLSTQRREPPFLLNKRILHRQMDKCSVTLVKNMHVKLLNSICKTCFDLISIVTDCLSMNRAYMAHTEKGCTLSRCQIMKGFSILITPYGVDALPVSQYLIVNDIKCDSTFRTITLMSCLYCMCCQAK